jgi:hypothetical protein
MFLNQSEAIARAYRERLSVMEKYPPDRFIWICDKAGDASLCAARYFLDPKVFNSIDL